MESNVYGEYTDPYLVGKGARNPMLLNLTTDGEPVTNWTAAQAGIGKESVKIPLQFNLLGSVLDYVRVPGLKALDETAPQCPDSPTTQAPADEGANAGTGRSRWK